MEFLLLGKLYEVVNITFLNNGAKVAVSFLGDDGASLVIMTQERFSVNCTMKGTRIWNMTKVEYEAKHGKPKSNTTITGNSSAHKRAVEIALNLGCLVPDAVLADYPELKLQEKKMKTTEPYKNWTNRDTWECFNLLTSYEDVYCRALENKADELALEALTLKALERSGADIEYLMFHQINWTEIMERLEKMGY